MTFNSQMNHLLICYLLHKLSFEILIIITRIQNPRTFVLKKNILQTPPPNGDMQVIIQIPEATLLIENTYTLTTTPPVF